MNDTSMLDFLMEHDVVLLSIASKKKMSADEMYVLGGEFVVYDSLGSSELYRGLDFDLALLVLESWL